MYQVKLARERKKEEQRANERRLALEQEGLSVEEIAERLMLMEESGGELGGG